MFRIITLAVSCVLALSGAHADERADNRIVNLYSAQKEHLIRPVMQQFEAETGIKVNVTTGDAGTLVSRLEAEAELSPADVLLTTDIANIYRAHEKGLLQAVNSTFLRKKIPARLRSEQNDWFGFAERARPLFVRKTMPADERPHTYAELATATWKGSILVSTSRESYNQSLLSSIIARSGKEYAEEWARGVVANMVRKPQGNERDQLRALASGMGKVAIANSYYYGILLTSEDPKDRELAEKLDIIFPNQHTTGTHVNIRGGGITRHAKHVKEATKLLEFLATEPAQRFFTDHNKEFPAVETVMPTPVVASWPAFKRDSLPLAEIGKYNSEAVTIFDRVQWP